MILTLFGQANGVTILFDPATKTVPRLPSSYLALASAR